MQRRRMLLLALAASVLLSTVGCAAAVPPPAPSKGELAALQQKLLDDHWHAINLPKGVKRPVVAKPQTLAEDELYPKVDSCIRRYAATDYLGLDPTGALDDLSVGARMASFSNLADYACSATYRLDPSKLGLLGNAQKAALYDYYQRWVVPCLASRGYTATGAPSRNDFVSATYLEWSPLDSLYDLPTFTQTQYDRLAAACTAYPSWLYPETE